MALNSSQNDPAMNEPRLVRQWNRQQVKRSDSNFSMPGSAIHCVSGCARITTSLIAICNLRASRSASMNNLASQQMSLCRF
jgi:hypothetical protein